MNRICILLLCENCVNLNHVELVRGDFQVSCNCSVAQSCRTLCDPMDHTARQASLTFSISWSLHKLMFIESVTPSNHFILGCPLLLPSIFPSIRVFSSESALHIKWSFSFSPSNEYSGWISFRLEWFDLPAVQGTLKSLLQHHSLKTSVLQCPALFMVQFSHQVYYILLLFCVFIPLIFENLILKPQLKILTYLLKKKL